MDMEGIDIVNGVSANSQNMHDGTHFGNDNNKLVEATIADCVNKFIGTQVVVETLDSELYTGILRDCSNEFDVTLSFAQKMPIAEDNAFILCEGTTDKLLELKKVARLTGDYYVKEQNRKAFRTDREIGADCEMDDESKEKELEPWDCDGDDIELDDLSTTDDRIAKRSSKKGTKGEVRGGWTVNEMFEMNKDKVVGTSTFDASLCQYSNVGVVNCSEEQIKRAEEIAKAIETNQESKRNALLENDDEEKDLHTETETKDEELVQQQSFQQPQHQQRQQRPARDLPGQKKVGVGGTTGPGKRWHQQERSGPPPPGGDRNADQQATGRPSAWNSSNSNDWRNPPQQRYFNKPGGYQQTRQFQPQNHQPYGNKMRYSGGNRTTSYGINSSQGLSAADRAKVDAPNELRMATIPNSNGSASTSKPSQHQNEDQTLQQIPPDPEVTTKQTKISEEVEQMPQQRSPEISEAERKSAEAEKELEEQKKKFEFNPDAEPFIPKVKDLNSTSVASTFTTTPLMSSQISTFVPVQVQVPSAAAQGVPPPNIMFYQQPQTVVQSHMPSNSIYAAYQTGNPTQPIIYLAAPNQAVILQHAQQHFIPISTAALPPQNVNFHPAHYRTGTPNSANNQVMAPSQPLVDSATGNPMIAQPTAIFAPSVTVPQPNSGGAPISASGMHNAVPLFSNYTHHHVPPNMQHFRTGTPNGGGGINLQTPPHHHQPHSQQQLVDPGTANTVVAQQQNHQFVTQPVSSAVHPIGGNTISLLSNFTHQLPPNMHHHYRTGTPNGAQGQQQVTHPQADATTGNNPLTSQQQQIIPANIYQSTHPAAQGTLIQQNAPVQPLFNFTQMPPNAVVSVPPPFHGGRQQQQQF